MSEFKIQVGRSRESGEQLRQISLQLSAGAGDVSGIRARLDFDIKGKAQIDRRLKTISEQLERESRTSEAARAALESIIQEYELTESRLSSASLSNGQIDTDGTYFYHKENGKNVTNSFREYVYDGKTVRRYFGPDGKMVTGWALVNGAYRYFCEMMGTPTYGAQASKNDVIDYILSGKSFKELARYQYMDRFLNELSPLEEIEYSLAASKKTLTMIIEAAFDPRSAMDLAGTYMNNEDECRKLLTKLVEAASGNSYSKLVPSEPMKYTKLFNKIASDVLGKDNMLVKGSSGGISLLAALEDGNEAMVAARTKYEKNIAILETLKKSVPQGSTMARCIERSIGEYHHKAESAIKDAIAELQPLFRGSEGKTVSQIMKLESGQGLKDFLVEKGLDAALGKTFMKGFDYTEKVLELDPKVSALNDIIYGSGTVNYSMDALRNAENVLRDAYRTGDPALIDNALMEYNNCFSLAKAAKGSQIKAMRDFHKLTTLIGGSDQYVFYDQQMKALEKAPMYRCA